MFQSLVRDVITLFVTVNPIAVIPFFLAATKTMSAADRRRTAVIAVAVASAVLIGFLVVGQVVLEAMGVRIAAFQMAGGLILLLVGLRMVFEPASDAETAAATSPADIAIFPLGLPLISGPGSITAVMVLTDNDRYSMAEQAGTALVLLGVMAVTAGVLFAAGDIQRLLRAPGVNLLSRVMGLVLASLAVTTMIAGVRTEFLGR